MTDRPDATALVALVGSRIAHDLASPIGAIANGVELLGLTGREASPELDLIAESVANASARIKTFRIAFGAAQAGQVVPEAEIAALATGDGRRLEIAWRVPGDVARADAKLAVLALMCLEAALPWGGRVTVTRDGTALQIAASADRTKADTALWDFLAGLAPAPESVAPAQVQFLLLAAEAAAQSRALHLSRGETAIRIAL
ncbi:MAG: hypothetical protein AUK37_07605 [Rhodobacterales bacterium CG2_30_65_12]|nr:MAG: hypothetical protein AUK37_07605 [Rhodobacterales bacterium CG2_30_65_12]